MDVSFKAYGIKMMKAIFCKIWPVLALCFPSFLGGQDSNGIGYVVICVAKVGNSQWNTGCLDMPYEVAAPPRVKSYSGNLAGIWATLFPQVPVAVSPSLIDRPLPEAERPGWNNDKIDASVLFDEFLGLGGAHSLHQAPLMKLTPPSSVTRSNNIFSTETAPVMLLSDSRPMGGDDWRKFTIAGEKVFRAVTDQHFQVTSDDNVVEQFWRIHVPQTLSHGETKLILSVYRPLEGCLIYKCEIENYQGMAQGFLDFFTRP